MEIQCHVYMAYLTIQKTFSDAFPDEKVFHLELQTVLCKNNNKFMHLSFILFLHKKTNGIESMRYIFTQVTDMDIEMPLMTVFSLKDTLS